MQYHKKMKYCENALKKRLLKDITGCDQQSDGILLLPPSLYFIYHIEQTANANKKKYTHLPFYILIQSRGFSKYDLTKNQSAHFYSNPRMSPFVYVKDFMSIVLLFFIHQHCVAHIANFDFVDQIVFKPTT
jgi:hypothetical protein